MFDIQKAGAAARLAMPEAQAQVAGSMQISNQLQGKESRFSVIHARLRDHVERTQNIADRLESLADAIAGPTNAATAKEARLDTPPPGHLQGALEDALQRMDVAHSRIFAALNRLEAL